MSIPDMADLNFALLVDGIDEADSYGDAFWRAVGTEAAQPAWFRALQPTTRLALRREIAKLELVKRKLLKIQAQGERRAHPPERLVRCPACKGRARLPLTLGDVDTVGLCDLCKGKGKLPQSQVKQIGGQV
jgi:hypothetical protein